MIFKSLTKNTKVIYLTYRNQNENTKIPSNCIFHKCTEYLGITAVVFAYETIINGYFIVKDCYIMIQIKNANKNKVGILKRKLKTKYYIKNKI